MTKTTLLDEKLRELSLFEPVRFPVLSMYINTQPDQHGRDNYASFVRKALDSRASAYSSRSVEKESFDSDSSKIADWLRSELLPASNGAVVFACAGAGEFFDTLQLEAPIDEHEFHVGRMPQLNTLARVNSEYPAYAAVVADTNTARIFVFGLAHMLNSESIENTKVRSRTQVGGWSQARYQRHVENYHLHHVKEVVDRLDKLLQHERVEFVIFAGDEVILPILREQLTPRLAQRVIDGPKLDISTPEHVVLEATLAAVREHHATSISQEVSSMLDKSRAGGLAAADLDNVLTALVNGQVDTLFLSTSSARLGTGDGKTREKFARLLPVAEAASASVTELAGALVTRAYQTSASVRFTEDAALQAAGGVGATLRYRANSGEDL